MRECRHECVSGRSCVIPQVVVHPLKLHRHSGYLACGTYHKQGIFVFQLDNMNSLN